MPNTASAADTRERLLLAALEVFAESGFEAATVREICRRAGANVAAIHYHFGDKKRLYIAIFEQVFELLRQRRASFLPPDAPAEDRLHTYIRALFEEIFHCQGDDQRCAQLAALYMMEMSRPTEMLDAVVASNLRRDAEELYSIVGALLGPASNEDEIINCSASVVGQILYYYHAEPMVSRLHPNRSPVAERLDELVEHVWRFSLAGVQYRRCIP